MNFQEKVAWFFGLKPVRYAQIFIVVMGDLLALANLYPKHCRYIARPFLLWEEPYGDEDEDEDEAGDKKQLGEDDNDDTGTN